MRVLIAIPVYNEEAHLEPVLTEVLRYASDGPRRRRRLDRPDCAAPGGVPDRSGDPPPQNQGYGAGLKSAFQRTLEAGYDGLVTLDCDGQHEPSLVPMMAARLAEADIVSGSRYLEVFYPNQKPPEQRRKINVEVTRWLNECLGLNLTDAFCGFKAYRASALAKFEITDLAYAMPLQVWVQAAAHGLSIVEAAVPLIYLDESRAFGGALDNAEYRLNHYREVFQQAVKQAGLEVAGGCC